MRATSGSWLIDGGLDDFENLVRLGHPSDAFGSTTQPTLLWIHKDHSIVTQLLDVALDGGFLPHFAIHGRRGNHRSGEAEIQGTTKIVGLSRRGFAEEVRCRRDNAQQLGRSRQLDMSAQRECRIKKIGYYLLTREHGIYN